MILKKRKYAMDDVFLQEHKITTKFNGYYNTLCLWMTLLQKGGRISDYFAEGNTVAIYGMGKIGELIYNELCQSGVNVSYGMDQNLSGNYKNSSLQIYFVEEARNIEKVDYIVISISYMADKIVQQLEELSVEHIVTIDEILEELLEGR